MKPIDRKVYAPAAGGPGRGRVVTLLMCLMVAAAVAGLYGVPRASAQNFGTVNLNSSSSVTTVTVTLVASGTLSSILVSTQGISGMDFSKSGGGTCALSTPYTSTQSCTVDVTFSPIAPGLRLGAVELFDGSGTLLGTGYIYGTGKASLLRYNPGTQAVLYSGLSSPQAMVVDAGKNIYVADTLNTRVLKLPWNGASYGTAVTLGSGWLAPSGVAVDGAGNLYVADASLNQVVEVPWTGSAYGTQVAISGIYTYAQDLTIDGSGNLYILTSASTITKLPWNGTAYGAPATIGSGLSGGQYNTDVVDSSGNIYIADYNNGNIVKETLSGGIYTQTILGNFGAPSVDGVATDPAGNVYIANYSGGSVLMLPWTGSGYGAPITLTSNGLLSGPEAIYLDGIGNIYIEDFNNNLVDKWSVTNLPTLTFSTPTDVGSADATNNPQTVSLLNIGNNALTIAVPAEGDNPSLSSGFSYDSSSTCPQLSTISVAATLAEGASCIYAVDFAPAEPGANTGSLVLTDNYLGASTTTQSIGLSGTGISLVTKLAFGAAPATPIALGGNAGSSIAVDEEKISSVLDTDANDLITLTVTGPSSYSQPYTATAVAGVATFNLGGAALSTPGVYTYTASLAGATSATASETVNNTTPQSISFSPSTPLSYGVAPITLSATGGASGNAVTFSHVSGPGTLSGTNNTMLTVTGAGTIVIAANQAGNSTYSAATQVTADILVNQATLSVVVNPVSSVYGVAFPTLSGALSGVVSGDSITASYATTATPTSPAGGSYTIVATLHDPNTKLGNYTVTNTPAALSITKPTLSVVVNPVSSVYGVAFPALSGTLSGVVSGDGITASYATTATPASTAGGSYTVVGTLHDPNAKLGNYSVTNTPAALSVTKATLSVVVNLVNSVYGIAFPTFGGILSGVVSGDGITASYATTATPTSPAGGSYFIIATLNDPNAKLGNYSVTNTPAVLSITKPALRVVVNPVSSVYGVAFPTLSGTLSGVVSGDGITASYSTTATPSSPAGGSYTIIATLNDPNAKLGSYSVTNTAAALSITKAALSDVVNSVSSVYGVAFPAFGGTLSGVILGDGITASYSTTATPTSPAGGSYSIVATLNDPNAKLGNYSVTNTPAALSITKPALSVVVNPVSSVYGVAFPTLSGTLSGVVSGDGITASYSTTATPTSPAGGSYSIIATLNDPNAKLGSYSVTNTPAALSITKATSGNRFSSSVNPVLLSDPTTLTATVSSAAGLATGTVNFLDNATPIGSAALSNGIATLIVSSLTVGSHSLSAVYSGDTNFSASSSAALTQSVVDFTTVPGTGPGTGGAGAPSQATAPGGAATFMLSIVPTAGVTLPAPAVFTLTGMPAGATATVTPSSWMQTSSTSWSYPANIPLANIALTIQLPSVTARKQEGNRLLQNLPPILWGLLLVPFVGRLRRKSRQLGQTKFVLLLVAGCAVTVGAVGCGSRNGFFAQPAKTYSMTETVTAGALSHSATITLTVQ